MLYFSLALTSNPSHARDVRKVAALVFCPTANKTRQATHKSGPNVNLKKMFSWLRVVKYAQTDMAKINRRNFAVFRCQIAKRQRF
jgi:hypothetical protein